MNPPFKKILIANRGEIAIRIARAATELGIRTVGIFSYEDRYSLHRYKTDESYRLGQKGFPLKAYLDMDPILDLASRVGAEAIHPGYGFLSENEDFARKAQARGIIFIGPSPEHLGMFGDKVEARKEAKKAGLPTIPGTLEPLKSLEEAKETALGFGYPVTLKAVSGGGGKGIRMIGSEPELQEAFERAQSEALSSFGRADLYMEKTILSPRHVEVQILGDQKGHWVHLFSRDCSVQRRHQKVVEVAPAFGLPADTLATIYEGSLKLARNVGYYGLGTVEFLVDPKGQAYFLEVNPRVQVEHTVTEMITGIDLIQASILVASGASLDHPIIGIKDQSSIKAHGYSIQCRVTTEDPLGGFVPDMGKIIAYRPAAGFGIRLDEGHGTAGGLVTPYYDSLLVKVTSWARTLEQAASKVARSLSEFRIRGVKHNIPLLKKIVRHPAFLAGDINTDFLTKYPELFSYPKTQDRATKLLSYLAQVSVNDLHQVKKKDWPTVDLPLPPNHYRCATDGEENAKSVFDRLGSKGLVQWIKDQKSLLLTDTTMRDAHQSLFATRLRTKDMVEAAPYYAGCGHHFFSLEIWGGATFDTAMRFLREDPWERLRIMREKVPNVLLQMLLRGDNAVGYTNYPRWVIDSFIKETVATGLDLFRIFDCLNQLDKMAPAIESVKKYGGLAEVSICYTGDLSDPKKNSKYNLAYYLDQAKAMEHIGADILCIKDMAGLLKPRAATLLIRALKDHVGLPIHLHTHDTSGAQIATLLAAAEAGCEIVDGAMSSMSGLTSQPSLNALAACLSQDPKCPRVSLESLDELARYWEVVRSLYQAFDPGIKSTTTEVYRHEIPGGQYSNLYHQAVSVGVSPEEFYDLTRRYGEVNQLLGDIVKVTPSSKVVGDLALLLQKNKLTGPELLQKKPHLDYPDSLVSFFKGHMGVPHGGFPEEMRALVLGDNPPPPAPEPLGLNDRMEDVQKDLSEKLSRPVSTQEALSYRLYPKVFLEYVQFCQTYSPVLTELPTKVFFYGLRHGQEIEVNLEPGKTLYVTLKGISSPDPRGIRNVFFSLNGFDREISVQDESLKQPGPQRIKADGMNPSHVAAPMPGKVILVKKKPGDETQKGEALVVIEAMKMEYGVSSKVSGQVKEILVKAGDMVEQGDLIGVVELS
jgi:pyruvate carboxylase